MKKVALLTVLLVVAASAAITIEFPDDPPDKVGDSVKVTITASVVVDLAVDSNGTKKPWVSPQTLSPGTNYVQITHPGSGLMLYASKLGDEDYSDPFDVVIGDAERWQIIGPGQTSDPGNAGNPSGKTPNTATVTAGDVETYPVNLCDKWYNVVDPNPTGYTITTDDPFGRVNDDQVEFRTAGTWKVTVSGGGYVSDESTVKVNPGPATQLLIICGGERHEPGDTLTAFQKGGKVEDPIRARAVVGVPYKVNVHVVDDAWNTVTNYPTGDSLRVTGGTAEPLGGFYVVEGGIAKDVEATFVIADADGKDIYAENKAGNLTTQYPTKVFVDEGVLFIEASFDKPIVPSNVSATLTARAYLDSATTVGAGFPITVELVDGPAGELYIKDPLKGDSSDTKLTIETISIGEATAKVWAEAESTYTIRVTAGEISKDLALTVQELKKLLVAPNPYKYSVHGDIPINFIYKVEQIGQGGASEVVLLIADPFGNIVYRVTYDLSAPQTDPGQQTIPWDRTNSKGNRIASGMYQAVLKITLINGETKVLKKNFMVIW